MIRFMGVWVLFSLMAGLVACSSGGGGSTSSVAASESSSLVSSSSSESSSSVESSSSSLAADINIGVFWDSPVINIGYRTETQEGKTNEQGQFYYKEGESVTFFIGLLEFPAVLASPIITPFTLADTEDLSFPELVNTLRFLQSLDSIGDLSDGITIADVVSSLAEPMDFDLSIVDFASSAAIVSLLADLGIDNLVDAAFAVSHFRVSLGLENAPETIIPNDVFTTFTYTVSSVDIKGDLGGDTSFCTEFFDDDSYVWGRRIVIDGNAPLAVTANDDTDEVIPGSGYAYSYDPTTKTISWVYDSRSENAAQQVEGFVIYSSDLSAEQGDIVFEGVELDSVSIYTPTGESIKCFGRKDIVVVMESWVGWPEKPGNSEVNSSESGNAGVELLGVYFDDSAFVDCVQRGGDLLDFESVTSLYCDQLDITSVAGIENFTNLSYLKLNSNQLKNVDLSGNENLKFVWLLNNNIESITLSNSTELEAVALNGNTLTQVSMDYLSTLNTAAIIDVLTSNDPILGVFINDPNLAHCVRAELRYYDIVALEDLHFLGCSNAGVITLDGLESLIGLDALYLGGNELTEIDLSHYPLLNVVGLDNNPFSVATLEYLNSISWMSTMTYSGVTRTNDAIEVDIPSDISIKATNTITSVEYEGVIGEVVAEEWCKDLSGVAARGEVSNFDARWVFDTELGVVEESKIDEIGSMHTSVYNYDSELKTLSRLVEVNSSDPVNFLAFDVGGVRLDGIGLYSNDYIFSAVYNPAESAAQSKVVFTGWEVRTVGFEHKDGESIVCTVRTSTVFEGEASLL